MLFTVRNGLLIPFEMPEKHNALPETHSFDGLRAFFLNLPADDRTPEEKAAEQRRWQEQEERIEAFWELVGGRKQEKCLYKARNDLYTYEVYVDYAISSDGKVPYVMLTIQGDGYPSHLRLKPAAALALISKIVAYKDSGSQEHFRVDGYAPDYARASYFNLNRKTMINLLKWLKRKGKMLYRLTQEN